MSVEMIRYALRAMQTERPRNKVGAWNMVWRAGEVEQWVLDLDDRYKTVIVEMVNYLPVILRRSCPLDSRTR